MDFDISLAELEYLCLIALAKKAPHKAAEFWQRGIKGEMVSLKGTPLSRLPSPTEDPTVDDRFLFRIDLPVEEGPEPMVERTVFYLSPQSTKVGDSFTYDVTLPFQTV